MAIKDNKSDAEYFEWTTEEEIKLFSALNGLKPVGINRYFYMACIVDKLSKALNRKVTSDQIWAHLKTMYNLKALNDLELLIPFPNEQQDFALPEIEFSSYNLKRLPETEIPPVEPSVAVKSAAPISSGRTPSQDRRKPKEPEKKPVKVELDPKFNKRTRGSLSEQSVSPANTPPSLSQNTKRRRFN